MKRPRDGNKVSLKYPIGQFIWSEGRELGGTPQKKEISMKNKKKIPIWTKWSPSRGNSRPRHHDVNIIETYANKTVPVWLVREGSGVGVGMGLTEWGHVLISEDEKLGSH